MSPLARWLMSVVAALAVCGVVVSSVSLQHHYAKSKTEYCDVGEAFDCDIVNRSEYSEIFGIPVALIGIIGYALLGALASIWRQRREAPSMIFAGGTAGLAFALYLTYIEARVLGVWCILCLSSLALIFAIAVFGGVVWAKSRSTQADRSLPAPDS